MSARQIAIGKALQELEPDLMDLKRLVHMVSMFTTEAMEGCSAISDCDTEAIVFGLGEIRRRTFALATEFNRAFDDAPPLDE